MVRNRLGVFVRAPVPGQVKTRMAPALGPEAACDLYRAFLGDLFERLQQGRVSPVIFYSDEPAGEVAALLPAPWPLVPQSGADLGKRMAGALAHLLDRPDTRAVLIGSDSPDLPLDYIRRAFKRLKHRDAVIGPATDGGYYLIGVRKPTPALFENVDWGTPAVFASTVEICRREGLTLSVLPPWYDVDDAASLELLRSLCAARRLGGGVRLPRTERILR